MSANKVHALIYSNASVIHQFGQDPFRSMAGDLLVEISAEPNLALALGMETPSSFPGIGATLGEGVTLDDLSVESKSLPVPIVLAAGSTVSAQALDAAVSKIPDLTPAVGTISLLIHVQQLEPVRFSLAYVDRLSVLWDLADLPPESLPGLGQFLAEEDILGGEFWGGFHPYKTDERPYRDETVGALEEIFAPYAAAQ